MKVFVSRFGRVFPLECLGETENGFLVDRFVTRLIYRESRESPLGEYKAYTELRPAVLDALEYIEKNERVAVECLERMAKYRQGLSELSAGQGKEVC